MDYSKLAQQNGGAIVPSTPSAVDYSALASQHGGVVLPTSVNTPTPINDNNTTSDTRPWYQKATDAVIGGVKKVGNILTSSEQGFGQDTAGAASNVLPQSFTGIKQLNDAAAQHTKNITDTTKLIQQYKNTGRDTTKLQSILNDELQNAPAGWADLYPSVNKSALQVLGDAGGVALDIATAGSYGAAAKGAKAGELLAKSASIVEKTGAQLAKTTLTDTLKTIGKQTAIKSATGAGIGYGYDVANNAQSGKTGVSVLKPGFGTAIGAIAPVLIGGVKAGVTISKDTAPRFINSLIKPNKASFSYGKDPGRTVAELGITGNSLPDFANNITKAKNDIGTQLGNIYSNPANANIKIDLSPEIQKLDSAISDAAKGGKNNQAIVTQLQNTKDALLYEHGVDANGNITKTGEVPRDLSSLTPKEAFDFKQEVSQQTRFTGNPSDDKTVNSILKNIYGGTKSALNNAVKGNNPEIEKLNQQYADLTSAELATKNRDAIVKRSDLVSLKSGATGAITGTAALLLHAGSIPAALIAGTGFAIEKAFETAAVKTRVASWLGSESPSVIRSVIEKNPAVGKVLSRTFPKYASYLGASKAQN